MTKKVLLTALDGRIQVWKDPVAAYPELTGSPREVAQWLLDNGVNSWMNSSSMDFGTEYGFAEDDVRSLVLEEGDRILADEENEAV